MLLHWVPYEFQADLEDLNRHLDEPLPMNRFRPNVVIKGTDPWVTDKWDRITMGQQEGVMPVRSNMIHFIMIS